MSNPGDKLYRILYKYKNWINKPSASVFGEGEWYSDDPGWISDKATELKRKGCKVLAIEKLSPDGFYREISMEQERARQEMAEMEWEEKARQGS